MKWPSKRRSIAGVLVLVAVAAVVVALILTQNTSTSTASKSKAASTHGAQRAVMLVWTAWAQSKHANTQTGPAGELADSHPGETPDQVAKDEDCIACHAPTAVLFNGGMTEAQALGHYFTTSEGKFTKATTVDDVADWPGVSCAACHDPAKLPGADNLAYFNSATGRYQPMSNADQLCGQCHGNLRFPGTDHVSYNILRGTGGVGVPGDSSMAGVACTGCHMFRSGVAGSNSAQFGGHTWAITVEEANGKATSSCTQGGCHTTWTAAQAETSIASEIADFKALDAMADKIVAAATDAMKGVSNSTLQAALNEAEHNLAYAESDESGGFHNHRFVMALLRDANDKAQAILRALHKSA